jgi:hypothetical protein
LYKKAVAIFIFVVGLSFPVFSADESDMPPDTPKRIGFETVFALGFEFGNFWGSSFDAAQSAKKYRFSPGINVQQYFIRDDHTVGLFVHAYRFGFPNKGSVDEMQQAHTKLIGIQSRMFVGPLFRHIFNEKFTLFYAPGMNYVLTTQAYTQHIPSTVAEESITREVLNIGIGANVMLKYTISHYWLLFAGSILTYDFLSFVNLNSPSNPALHTFGITKGFSMFGIRPYVSVGFRL